MNTTSALTHDIHTTLGFLTGLTNSCRSAALRDQKAQDSTITNEESHWLGSVGSSLSVLVVLGLGGFWIWAIAYLTTLVLQHQATLSDLGLALSS